MLFDKFDFIWYFFCYMIIWYKWNLYNHLYHIKLNIALMLNSIIVGPFEIKWWTEQAVELQCNFLFCSLFVGWCTGQEFLCYPLYDKHKYWTEQCNIYCNTLCVVHGLISIKKRHRTRFWHFNLTLILFRVLGFWILRFKV